MYKCRDCSNVFIHPAERTVDAGGIRDTGVIGKAAVTFIRFCPSCSSRKIKEVEDNENM